MENAPRVCVIDDYKQIIPHEKVDFIVTTKTDIPGNKQLKIRDKIIITKEIKQYFYDEPRPTANGIIEKPYPLNSFDGQGLADPGWMIRVAWELGYKKKNKGYIPSQLIIRAPWIKGLLVNFDWKLFLRQHGVTTIKDIYGTEMKIDDVDILLSKSQFKMHRIYDKKGGWKFYEESMNRYGLKWGVCLPNKEYDVRYKELNYQYLSALDLTDEQIDSLCEHHVKFLTDICNTDKEEAFLALMRLNRIEKDDEEEATPVYESLMQRAIKINKTLLHDRFIQNMIHKGSARKNLGTPS